jgi:Subtilase family
MTEGGGFPHLNLTLRDKFRAKFGRGVAPNPEVEENKNNRANHVDRLRGSLQRIGELFQVEIERRRQAGLPAVDAGVGFVMRIPAGADPDHFAHALGVELVAETDGGFMLVASEDLTFQRLDEILAKFERGSAGGGAAAALLDVFESPDAPHRIERLLTPDVLQLWPFQENQEYIFDVSIQTAVGTRSFSIPRVGKRRKDESAEQHKQRKQAARQQALANADNQWADAAENRFEKLVELVSFYGGEILDGIAAAEPTIVASAIRFPDSFQVRARLSGRGWTDIIRNLQNIFEVCLPDNVEQPLPPSGVGEGEDIPNVTAPDEEAPAVCVVDSGIQEAHIWLEAAMDSETSRCFLPGQAANNIQDEVAPSGHGTRVAGAVLYPRDVPKDGEVKPVAWLQNARVLNAANQIPTDLPPAKYIEEVVAHFKATPKQTRLYNHSVAANVPCTLRRMSTWATKIDELAHDQDVLFIQSAGNILRTTGQQNNPGVLEHLQSGRTYPAYLEQPAARIANPAQSLQALTVGSVAAGAWIGQDKHSFATDINGPSAFSRSGYGIWNAVKPDVVEIGGDYAIADGAPSPPTIETETAVELVRTAGDGGPAVAKDDVGTSYAAPKVAHLAAVIQRLFPDSPTLLYRGLIVHSARWPNWMNGNGWSADRILKLIGFGLPSAERATENTNYRVTLVTPTATTIRNQELHLYRVVIPDELRNRAEDITLRIEVTLSYSSEPRRTRSSRRGYLATWLDWRSSGLGEPFDAFKGRMVADEEVEDRDYPQPNWCLHYFAQHGDANQTQRGNGTVQKDWARVQAHELTEEFFIAVRAHKGWDHREDSGGAKYCLIVSIEAEDVTIPVYATVAAVNVEVEAQVVQEIVLPAGTT